MNVGELALVFHEILKGGGFATGGLNFDAKLRRQSIEPDDLIHAHVGSMDSCARAFLAAADMLDASALTAPLAERYAGWAGLEGCAILAGERSLADLAERALGGLDPQPRSGRQEYLESLVNRYL
jgi:xylose isomerase